MAENRSNIWIVEDEPELAQIYAESLSPMGSCRTFASTEEALKVWYSEETTPDLLVSDIRLPGSSGINLVEQLRGTNYQGPVILVSGHADKQALSKAVELDVCGVLDKPMSPDSLVDLATKAIQEVRKQELLKFQLKIREQQVNFYLELTDLYVARIARAENLAESAGLPIFEQDKVQFLANTSRENKIHRELKKLSEKLNDPH